MSLLWVRQFYYRILAEHLPRVAHQLFIVGNSQHCHCLLPVSGSLSGRQLKSYVSRLSSNLYHHIMTCQPLHALIWGNPSSSCHIAVAGICLEVDAYTLGFLRGEDYLVPPFRREDLEGPFSVAMHLVVIYHTANAGLLEGFKVGCDALVSSYCLAMKPPHLGAGRVLGIVESNGQSTLCKSYGTAEQPCSHQHHVREKTVSFHICSVFVFISCCKGSDYIKYIMVKFVHKSKK